MNSFSTLPLMVPSFSSKGSVFIRQEDGCYVSDNHSLLTALNTNLPKAYLLSAYDVYYGLMPQDPSNWPQTEYLFIDSGGYEINQAYETTERNKFNYHVEDWTTERMVEVYKCVMVSPAIQNTTVVLSTFDFEGFFVDQLERAESLQALFPKAIVNFLVKINFTVQQLVSEITKHSERLKKFQVLGFAEKELGQTVQERIYNLILIKRILLLNGWKGCIHLFGGLSPLLAKIYYFAGADIFDGLSWQRERYATDSGLIDPAFFDISASEQDNRFDMMLDNLGFLYDMSSELAEHAYGANKRMEKLEKALTESRAIAEILDKLEVS